MADFNLKLDRNAKPALKAADANHNSVVTLAEVDKLRLGKAGRFAPFVTALPDKTKAQLLEALSEKNSPKAQEMIKTLMPKNIKDFTTQARIDALASVLLEVVKEGELQKPKNVSITKLKDFRVEFGEKHLEPIFRSISALNSEYAGRPGIDSRVMKALHKKINTMLNDKGAIGARVSDQYTARVFLGG